MSPRAVLLSSMVLASPAPGEPPPGRATIVYDAFGSRPGLRRDWGFAVWIESGGRSILFDAGNDPAVFAHNLERLGLDPATLDFAVVSHRHLDHAAGLGHVLAVRPELPVYAPQEAFGPFGSSLPASFYDREESLPEELRILGGKPPARLSFGSAWPGAPFELVDRTTRIAPGVHLVSLVSDAPGSEGLRELSLVLETDEGLVVVVGCSHPGVDRIVEAARTIDPRVHLVLGGFHLPAAPEAEIARVSRSLAALDVRRVAPGHCTGEPAQALLRREWGERWVFAGLGERLELPAATVCAERAVAGR